MQDPDASMVDRHEDTERLPMTTGVSSGLSRLLQDSPTGPSSVERPTAAETTRDTVCSRSIIDQSIAATCPCRTPVLLDMSRCDQTDLELLDWLNKSVTLVKTVPGLSSLPPADRTLLLSAAWKELVILYMAQSHFNFEFLIPQSGLDELAQKLSGPGTIPIRHGQCCIHWSWIEGIPTLRSVEQLRFILHKFREIRPDGKEYALLRVLLLFNADLRGLTSSTSVEAANERIHTALMEYENTCYPRDPLRLSHLLLLLPGVRGFSTKVFENLFFKHLTRDMNVEGVLAEMLRD
ncbi:nuclear receptor subfamily 0 group B member 2-like [Asterias rubens]|uniref:nuclear receptor subfamily 0 group B member 2-like n=1 Tax=Asterias rubens TaxID=7604 RepID=UPI001455C11E|nr:nuclear receptor subfamily 0 group B member 2-like [Asterias rubens]XP_033641769.1 nuclear receptor subfamily 0 group B member 2-like [Asterias rubens]